MRDMQRWQGRTALVTGASAGIGAAVARALAAAGLRVALTARQADRLEALRAELARDHGAEALAVPADLTQRDAPARVFAAVREAWGPVDVLVNNAGMGRNVPFEELSQADVDAMLDLNLRVAGVCMHEALRDMEGRSDTAIVNVSSVAAHRIHPGREYTLYTGTKYGLRGLTDAVRYELAQQGSPVKLALISPGIVRTEFHQRATGDPDFAYPLDEPLTPEDIAETVLFVLAMPRHVQINDIVLRPIAQGP